MNEMENLKQLVLAPYILKATALIGVSRRIGGNQFRHAFATLGILLDYKYFSNPVLLKAALLHDIFEDWPSTQLDDIKNIDSDGPAVVDLVLEVTKSPNESKTAYLNRLLTNGTTNTHILKCADRISNLTDLQPSTQSNQKFAETLEHTKTYIIPMAVKVNSNMVIELTDLVEKRYKLLQTLETKQHERKNILLEYFRQLFKN
jgi:(p)ppGpp synthase/HD superfamily hydrolase